MSTKVGTVVKLVPGRERSTAEVCTSLEALEGGSLGGLVRLVLGHEARQLFPEQCRDRTIAAGCQHPRLADEIVFESQRDVPLHRLPALPHAVCVPYHFHVNRKPSREPRSRKRTETYLTAGARQSGRDGFERGGEAGRCQ